MNDTKQIKKELAELNEFLKWKIDYVNSLEWPILFVLDYSPGNNDTPISFALSLEKWNENKFPDKCWATCVKARRQDGPRPHDAYKEFPHDGVTFYPFSANLSDHKPRDIGSIKKLIDCLWESLKTPFSVIIRILPFSGVHSDATWLFRS